MGGLFRFKEQNFNDPFKENEEFLGVSMFFMANDILDFLENFPGECVCI